MTKPVLHVPQKDSPQSSLAVGINDTETTLELDDASIFEGDAITRLTLGIDQSVTEVVTISSYDGDNEITVVRGTPAYSWPLGTLVARVLNADDITEIHQYLEDLNTTLADGSTVTNGDSHDHSDGDGAVIPEGGIGSGAVTEGKIATGAVTEGKIGTGAVTTSKIGANAIDGTKIADNAVNSEHIYAGAIDTNHIADGQVTALKLAANAVIEAKIATGAVTEGKIGTGAVTEGKLSFNLPKFSEGRLTLLSETPDTLADQTDKTTLYYSPYIGDLISLYDGTKWNVHTFAELSLSLSGYTASKPYDIFIYNNSGNPALESLVWSNATTRGTALVRQNGILVKSGDATRRYLGTIYISADGKTDDHQRLRGVWNNYNRICKMAYYRSNSANDLNFIIGNPVGQYVTFGAGGTIEANEAATAMYLRSTVEPSSEVPYTSELLSQHTDDNGHGMGQTEVGNFAAGLNYVGWDKGGNSTINYGHVWAEIWC